MSFKGLNLSSSMLTSLNKGGYFNPSPIQLRVIPKALKGETLLAQSATGSGKTLCYLVPILENIDINQREIQALIVVPTRELAMQIFSVTNDLLKNYQKDIKVRLIKSGEELSNSISGLSDGTQILIATPGRLNEVIVNNDVLSLRSTKTVVFDEADMLLKEGYFDLIDPVMEKINKDVQYLVFSATLENNALSYLSKYVGMNTPIINEDVLTSENVKHHLVDIKHNDKNEAVEKFINIVNPYLLLIFASKKETANETYKYLKERHYKVGLLTGDLSARERKNIMKMLVNEQIYILVCSDMASRGLDIKDVSDVLSIDLPSNLEFYYHRAGRTGRFDKKGNSYIFYNSDSTKKPLELMEKGTEFEFLVLKDNELVMGKSIEKSHPNKKKKDEELDLKIKKAKAGLRAKDKKVKPGYKKKIKQEVADIKRKHRREKIKKEIRKERIERYKREARNNG